MNPARWHKLMEQWGAPECDEVYSELLSAYSEAHRRYHTAKHIDDCLLQLDDAMSIADEPAEVELALWFHDAVYQPTSSKNEQKSADWAASFLASIDAPEDRSERVSAHILATKHAAEPVAGDAALVVDVDLSILGRGTEEFQDYEAAIREEYRWVPGPVYRSKRIEVLRSFLNRPAIYATEHFHTRYEAQSRENLKWAIQRLRK